jgi:hypothetical protein
MSGPSIGGSASIGSANSVPYGSGLCRDDSGVCRSFSTTGNVQLRFHELLIRKSELSLASSGKSMAILRPARASKRGRNAIVTERWRGLRWTLWRQVAV